MKNLLFLFCALTLFSSCATIYSGPKAEASKKIYSNVIDAPKLSKEELYIKSNAWVVDHFNDANSVLQFQDKDSGVLMGKYITPTTFNNYDYYIKSTFKIDIRDERVRITFYNATHQQFVKKKSKGFDNYYKPLDSERGLDIIQENWQDAAKSLKEHLLTTSEW